MEVFRPPFLETLSASAWARFVGEFEAYKARGGTIPARSLVSSSALRLIQLRLSESDAGDDSKEAEVPSAGASRSKAAREEAQAAADAEFVAAVSALFAPQSALESFDQFRAITMPDRSLTVAAVLDYVLAWDRLELLCARTLPSDEKLKALFIRNLKPARLAERVDFEGPSSLAKAKRLAVEQAEALVRMVREVRALSGAAPERRERRQPPAEEKTISPQPVQQKRELMCHGCGHVGHIRPDCPHRDAPGWVREGKCLRPLQIEASRVRPASQAKSARVCQEARQAVPRASLQLFNVANGCDGEPTTVSALLDTGSSVSLMSPELYRRLLPKGLQIRLEPRRVTVASGETVEVETLVSFCLRTSDAAGRPLQVPAEAYVMPCGEELLLGYPILSSSGLLSLLLEKSDGQEVQDLTVVSDDVDRLEDQEAEDCTPELAAALKVLENEYAELFEEDLPRDGAMLDPMPIQMKTGVEMRSLPPRRVSPAMRQVVEDEVKSLLEAGVIRESTSAHASPILMVRKPDGSYRLCVDYRSLNSVTVDLKYPMQATEEVLARLSGQKVFGCLDLRSGFHQMRLEERAIPLTAFVTPAGLFEFTKVPFGLKNAPPYFQRAMNEALAGLVHRVCEVFIDDVVVYGRDEQEFLSNLAAVFARLRERKLRLKRAKCRLGLRRIEYLGHIVDGSGVALSQARKQGLADLRPPKTPQQLKSFLGLTNYFRAFVKGYAQLAKPLTGMLSGGERFEWTDQAQGSWLSLKEAVVNAPLIHHLDYSVPIYLRTDASNSGVGGVLFQRIEGQERAVCFVSKAFSSVEARWATIEQEAYAVYFCILKLSHFLLGHHFTVETDHRNLLFLEKATSPKLVRWRLRLQEFDFAVQHVAGRENRVADALSRCFAIGLEELNRDEPQPEAVEGLDRDASGPIPDATAVFAKFHNEVVGHRGVKATLRSISEAGQEWPGNVAADVKRLIAACPVCQKIRLGQGSMTAALSTTAVQEPFHTVAIDTIGPLPEDDRGNRYIIVLVDCFTRFVELYPAVDVSAREAARAVLQTFGRYGCPAVLRSDRGSQFTAGLISELLTLLGTERQLQLAHRPQANGIVERTNAEVMRHLRALTFGYRSAASWSDALPLVQRILNSSFHSAIGTTPSRMMFGDAVRLDRAVLLPLQNAGPQNVVTVEDYVVALSEAQAELLRRSAEFQRGVVENRLRASPPNPDSFEEGDHVLVSYPERPPSKLAPRWRGPLVVVERKGSSIYSCQDLCTMRCEDLHISRLKAYDMAATPNPIEVAAADGQEWLVDSIVSHRVTEAARAVRRRRLGKRCFEFLVRWVGFGPEHDKWLPYQEVRLLEALDTYLAQHPELPF